MASHAEAGRRYLEFDAAGIHWLKKFSDLPGQDIWIIGKPPDRGLGNDRPDDGVCASSSSSFHCMRLSTSRVTLSSEARTLPARKVARAYSSVGRGQESGEGGSPA
ncbi:hypothetical protein GCM10027294_10410 [Marinactinospora endophytica]